MPMIFRSGFALLALLAAFAVHAAAWKVPPETMLETTSDRMLEVLKQQRQEVHQQPQRLYGIVEEVLSPHVDFPLVSQLVLGKYWRSASPDQRQRFMQEFRQMLVRFYAGALIDDPAKLDELLNHADTLVQFQPGNVPKDAVQTNVKAEVHLPSGQVVPVSFSVHHKGEQWQIYDVSVEGISLITNYRSSFSTEIRQSSLDNLIKRLAARNRELLEQPAAAQ